ncbi:MAG: hypothetical protein Q9219_006986 [cf. Caloplaca sp. 3 TL-2023]
MDRAVSDVPQIKRGQISASFLRDGMLVRTERFTFTKPALPKSLPPGWTTASDIQGKTMYIDPDTRVATYVNPIYGIAPAGYELKQTDTGRLFYVNRQDGSTTWHKPSAVDQLPAGWEAGRTADGKTYYINHVTKSNTWTKPTTPAYATNTHPPSSRPSVPVATRSAPTVNQLKPNVVQPLQPQFPAGHLPMSAIRPTNLHNQARTQANVALPSQVCTPSPPSHPVRPISSVSMLPQTQALSPQNTTMPLQAFGASTYRPNSLSGAPQQSPQLSPSSISANPTPSRPTLQGRIFSAPAASNAMQAASNMSTKIKESMTALVRNPGAQQAAVRIGQSAVQLALSDDGGTLTQDSADSGAISTDETDLINNTESSNSPVPNQPTSPIMAPPNTAGNRVSGPSIPSTFSRPMQISQSTIPSRVPATSYSANSSTAPSAGSITTGITWNSSLQGPQRPLPPSVQPSSYPQSINPSSVQFSPSQTPVSQPPAATQEPFVNTQPYRLEPQPFGSQPTQPAPAVIDTFLTAASQVTVNDGNPAQYTASTTPSYPSSSTLQSIPSTSATAPQYGTHIITNNDPLYPSHTVYSQPSAVTDHYTSNTNTSQACNDNLAQSARDAQAVNAYTSQSAAVQENQLLQQQQQFLAQQQVEQNALSNAILMQNAEAQRQQQDQFFLQQQAEQDALLNGMMMQDAVTQEQFSLQEEGQQNALSYI